MLGSELKKARIAAGITQEALAHRAKVSREYVSQLENDRKSPTVQILIRLCKVMGASAGDMIRRVEHAG